MIYDIYNLFCVKRITTKAMQQKTAAAGAAGTALQAIGAIDHMVQQRHSKKKAGWFSQNNSHVD